MPIKITMPALSPTMEEGNLSKWLVKEGDKVTSGDVIAEIETDKATMEVEAVDEGVVAKLVVPAGTEGVKVNALIAILAEDGEDVAEAAKSAAGGGDAAPAPKAEAAKEEQRRKLHLLQQPRLLQRLNSQRLLLLQTRVRKTRANASLHRHLLAASLRTQASMLLL